MKEQQTERWHAVYLNSVHIGDLIYRGNVTRFRFVDDYWSRPDRPVLGLQFEDNPKSEPRGNMKLPSWFSNLLPEDPLRTWIANDRDVSPDREMELLIRIGRDLPGAVIVDEVARESAEAGPTVLDSRSSELDQENNQLKFSLAGVAMKFSTLQRGDRLEPTHLTNKRLGRRIDLRIRTNQRSTVQLLSGGVSFIGVSTDGRLEGKVSCARNISTNSHLLS